MPNPSPDSASGAVAGSGRAVPVTSFEQPTTRQHQPDRRDGQHRPRCAHAVKNSAAEPAIRATYPCRQPPGQVAMSPSSCARRNRRRIVPPECQRRHQLGASGDRASPSHRVTKSLVIAPDTPRGQPAGRQGARRDPRAPGAVDDVPEGDVAAAGRSAAADGRRAARIRPRRRASGLAGAAGLRRGARRASSRVPTVAVFQTDIAGFAQSYGIGVDVARGVDLDAASAQQGRPHPRAVHLGDGRSCQPWHSPRPPVVARRGRHRLRTLGPRRAAAPVVVARR